MLDLKLFMDLQGDTPASLLLKPSSPGFLQYFIISFSVNYSVVVTGECIGELPDATPISFDVALSSVIPLLNKNHKFKLSYFDSILKFEEESGKYYITPLCVEHVNEYTLNIAQRYIDFSVAYTEHEKVSEQLDVLEREIAQTRENYQQARVTELSGFVNDSNPWGDIKESKSSIQIDDYYLPRIEEGEKELDRLRLTSSKFKKLDMDKFRKFAAIASRAGTVISMCDAYAVIDLGNAYALLKAECGARSLQGKLLRRLLMVKDGNFYDYNGEMIFVNTTGSAHDRTDTVVFITSYLPNTPIDPTIITRGSVKEKYKINLKGMFDVVSVVSSKFDTMIFDMGSSKLVLSNDRGESLVYNYDVSDAKTIELNKLLRGEQAGKIVMSSVEIPKNIQRFLPLLENDFTVYVKDRKIVLQSGDIYIVFGR